MKTSLLAVLSMILALTACDRRASFDPALIDSYRAEAQVRLRAFDDLSRQLSSLRLDREAAQLPLDGSRFATDEQLQGKVNTSGASEGPMPDGIILESAYLLPDARPNFDFELGERPYFLDNTREWLALQDDQEAPEAVAEYVHGQFRQLLALRHVIALRTVELQWPAVEGGGFRKGGYIGEALVFELGDGKAQFLGGFRFGGSNSDTVQVRYEEGREHQQHDWLVSDLKYNVYGSLRERLLARAPGARLPPTDWYKPTL